MKKLLITLLVAAVLPAMHTERISAQTVRTAALADKTYTVNGVSFTMIAIPAVTDGTLGYGEYDVNPAHMVSLPSYRIGGIDIDI